MRWDRQTVLPCCISSMADGWWVWVRGDSHEFALRPADLELMVTMYYQRAGRCRGCLVWGVRSLENGMATTDLVA